MTRQNIILIIVLAIIIIFIVMYLKKKNSDATTEIKNPIQTIVSNSGIPNVISSGSGSGSNNSTPPVIKTSGYSFGDNIYAKENNVNAYKTASASTGNLDSYKPFSKDAFIGTYLGKEGVFVKILIPNPAHSVFVLSTQVYSK